MRRKERESEEIWKKEDVHFRVRKKLKAIQEKESVLLSDLTI